MKKKNEVSNLEMKCSECGRVTKHYLSSKGEYRCLICGKVSKTIAPKKEMEVTFEADEELDKALNPQEVSEEAADVSTTEEVPIGDLLSEI